MERECLDCGTILRGRSDKKFCDDQCRSHYNNQIKAGMQSAMKPVNAILRKNHAILSRLCPENKIRIRKDDLLKKALTLIIIPTCIIHKMEILIISVMNTVFYSLVIMKY